MSYPLALLWALQSGAVLPQDGNGVTATLRAIAPKPVAVQTTLNAADVLFDPRFAAPVPDEIRSTDPRVDEIARLSQEVRENAADLSTRQAATERAGQQVMLMYANVQAARLKEKTQAFEPSTRVDRESAERQMADAGAEVQRAKEAEVATASLFDRSIARFQQLVTRLRLAFIDRPEVSPGRPVVRNRMLVLVSEGASEAGIRAALQRAGVRAVESIPSARILVVQGTEAALTLTQMKAQLDRLRQESVFQAATSDSLLSTQSLPKAGNAKATKGGLSYQDRWSAGPPLPGTADGTAWQKHERFPAAWNLVEGVQRVSPNGVALAILDEGFDGAHEDIELADCPIPKAASTLNPRHGNHVAGIVAARFDNSLGTAGATAGLVKPLACAVPPAQLFGPSSIHAYVQISAAIAAFADLLANVPSLSVVNISLGYGWLVDPATDMEARREIDSGGALVRGIARIAAQRGVIVVSAAGNDSLASRSVSSRYGNPFNWNARDPQQPARNIIVVESTSSTGTRSAFSNVDGDVSAEGENVLSCSAGGRSAYAVESGTSAAAPQVASVIALMRAYNPAISIDEVRTALGIDPRPASGTPRLDAFAALLRAAPKRALHDLADLNGDGHVDRVDFDILRLQYRRLVANPDSNYFPRIDLNGSGRFSVDDGDRSEVLGQSLTDLEVFERAADDPVLTASYMKANINP